MSMDDIEKLKARVERDPNSKLFLPLAEEYRKAGMLEEAISVLLKGLERQPGYTSARVALGKIYLEKKMIEDAQKEFEKVIAVIPDNLYAHKKLAEIYRDIGEIDRALSEYKTVIQINPLDEDARSFIEGIEGIDKETVSEVIRETEESFPIGLHEKGSGEVTPAPEHGESLEEAEIFFQSFEPLEDQAVEESIGIPEDLGFGQEVEESLDIPPEDMMEVKTRFPDAEEHGVDMEGLEEPIPQEGFSEMLPEFMEEPSEGQVRPPYVEEIESRPEEKIPTGHPEGPMESLKSEQQIFEEQGEVLDFSEADGFVLTGQYYKALERYKAMIREYPDNKKILQRMVELKNLLKLLGKDQEIILKLEALLEGIRRRRDEFFGNS